MYTTQKVKLALFGIRSLYIFMKEELKRGTLKANLSSLKKSKEISKDMSWGELSEEKAKKYPDRIFIHFEDKKYTYKEMDERANKFANYLSEFGGAKGKGIAILMDNSPEFMDVFIGMQKLGMYGIPVNTSLRGDSLHYIINHSDAEYIILDESYLEIYNKISDRLENVKTVIVNPSDNTVSNKYDKGMLSLSEAYTRSSEKPDVKYDEKDICFIMYTSGTTGLPKGVVYRYERTTVKLISLGANFLIRKNDVYYTCLPLFHANALMLTITQSMHVGATVALARKFSASKFWDDIRKHNVTVFNSIGAIIPILMKQPEKPTDNQNRVKFTFSAACPAEDWEKFEKRFGLIIYEGYGAVDGGGKGIINMRTAPVGSIGKPSPGAVYRLIDENKNDVPNGTPGELIFKASGKGKSVEYYKNDDATNDKLKDGWIHTGDLLKRDDNNFLYFVGRNTESMRIKGENVSAYEVEHAILQHPSILEAAVYAVPSELAEDEIMAAIKLVEGKTIKEGELPEFLKENLGKFALPRYVRIVDEFRKTETQRVQKRFLEEEGIASGTYDTQKSEYIGAATKA